jgi:hypothetical protein
MDFHEIHPRVAYDLAHVFIAKYIFTGSVKILNKIVFKIAIKFYLFILFLFFLFNMNKNIYENGK